MIPWKPLTLVLATLRPERRTGFLTRPQRPTRRAAVAAGEGG
jgi:hypothetical protein